MRITRISPHDTTEKTLSADISNQLREVLLPTIPKQGFHGRLRITLFVKIFPISVAKSIQAFTKGFQYPLCMPNTYADIKYTKKTTIMHDLWLGCRPRTPRSLRIWLGGSFGSHTFWNLCSGRMKMLGIFNYSRICFKTLILLTNG